MASFSDRPACYRDELSPALRLELLADLGGAGCGARAAVVHLPHGPLRTPVFMPVGTKGTIKGMTSHQLMDSATAPEIILGNTYHLALHPGTELVAEFGGLHAMMNWKNNILTDSGGFQMVSLLDLAEITERGVKFVSPFDGTEMLLTPEESIKCQNDIGSDIMMQLDDVVSSTANDTARFTEACARSVRWLDRCIAAHRRPREQNLFAIIQGGLDVSPGGLRDQCLEAMVARNTPGYAIGGLAGGESKDHFWRVVAHCCRALPRDKPRYLMGVGYPVDLVVCTALGVDMFDCVFPTRTARFGVALVRSGSLRLRGADMAQDVRSIDGSDVDLGSRGERGGCMFQQPPCECSTCRNYSRSYVHALLRDEASEALAAQLVTAHNVAYMMTLMRSMRQAIMQGRDEFLRFVDGFLRLQFPSAEEGVPCTAVGGGAGEEGAAAAGGVGDGVGGGGTTIPRWVRDALAGPGGAGMDDLPVLRERMEPALPS